jgi:hypothetical protein
MMTNRAVLGPEGSLRGQRSRGVGRDPKIPRLTHTPSPMGFLNEILERPASDKPFFLLVVGYAAEDCRVPVISKKPLGEIAKVWE